MSYGKYISVALASMLKFVGGPLAGLAFKLSWQETAICSAIGMMVSVLLVLFAGTAIRQIARRYQKATPRLFTKRTRLAVRIWQRAGLTGIAALTPILLTPIGGTALAISFKVPVTRILIAMLISSGVWGVIISWGIAQIPAFWK